MSHQKLDYEGLLRRAGHRVTPQRVAILDAVCMGHGQATLGQIAAAVRREDPMIALSTVYRTLKTLTQVGLVTTKADGRETVYDIAHP
jgi:Fe2+ or Zn2+ uptake regulation protein